jgi:hypothetical protein
MTIGLLEFRRLIAMFPYCQLLLVLPALVLELSLLVLELVLVLPALPFWVLQVAPEVSLFVELLVLAVLWVLESPVC